ncbi:YgjV family protein [Arenibaculum pallidiluteum]|uniref:YgjV family protein n=1 Tax=Arenibaculum pallidiluteum TaxID=2812559 RepID=UPI001A963637|nr:YgjV family protein [Arenibaculum pallidiluteum]
MQVQAVDMLTGTLDDILALLLAFVGMASLALWPLLHGRAAMLLLQLAGIASLALHYTLTGAATAAAVNTLGAAQISASLLFGARSNLRWIPYALAPLVVTAAALTWNGLPSLLAVAGTAFIVIGRVLESPERTRLLVVAGAPFWLAHDLLIWSPVVLADAATLVAGTVAVIRQQRRTRPASCLHQDQAVRGETPGRRPRAARAETWPSASVEAQPPAKEAPRRIGVSLSRAS